VSGEHRARRAVAGGFIAPAVAGWDYHSEDRDGWLPELALPEGECVADHRKDST
jgi:hypothetical protein